MAQEVNRKLKPQEPHERKGPALSVGHSRVVIDVEDAETEVWPTRLIWQGNPFAGHRIMGYRKLKLISNPDKRL